MSDKSNFKVNRRRIMQSLSAIGLGVTATDSAAGEGTTGDPDQPDESPESVPYEDLCLESQQIFKTALKRGRLTIRVINAPGDLDGVHRVTYEGDTYNLFSHSQYARLYHLNPTALHNCKVPEGKEAIDFEKLGERARNVFKSAVREGGFEGDGYLPPELRKYDFVAFEDVNYEVRSVEGTAKESVMVPRVV